MQLKVRAHYAMYPVFLENVQITKLHATFDLFQQIYLRHLQDMCVAKLECEEEIQRTSESIDEIRNAENQARTSCKYTERKYRIQLKNLLKANNLPKLGVVEEDIFSPLPPIRKQNLNANRNNKNVVNLSSYKLSEDEYSLLGKGLKFALPPKYVPITDTCAAIESRLEKLDNDTQKVIRSNISNVIHKQNFSTKVKDHKIVKNLKSKNDIIILSADKGGKTVIMNRLDYNSKCENMLNDDKVYEKVNNDPTENLRVKLYKKLKALKDQGKINSKAYATMFPNCAKIPYFYALPKIHKDNIPMRPIVSTIDSPTYNMGKYLSKIIKPVIGNTDTFLKNSYDFCNYINTTKIPAGYTQVSFDVQSLYTSVPISDAIEAFIASCSKQGITDLDGIKIDTVVELLRLGTSYNYFTFNNQVYRQISGFQMGGSLSGPLCNIFMEQLERNVIDYNNNHILCFKRYIDDIYCIVAKDKVNDILKELNNVHNNIKFTVEEEIDNALPFLDVLVTHNKLKKFTTTVYRKPTHSGSYINYKSYHQHKQKIGVIYSLVHRASRICSNKTLLRNELGIIKKELLNCDFPLRVINRHINMAANKFSLPPSDLEPKDTKKIIVSPYIGPCVRDINRIIKDVDLSMVTKPGPSLKNLLSSHQNMHKLQCRNAVYRIPCGNCDKFYIGETSKFVSARVHEHELCVRRGDIKYAVTQHTKLGHTMDWNNTSVLAVHSHLNNRRWSECFHINTNKVIPNNTSFRPINEGWIPLINKFKHSNPDHILGNTDTTTSCITQSAPSSSIAVPTLSGVYKNTRSNVKL